MEIECLERLSFKETINSIYDLRALFETRFNITPFNGDSFNIYDYSITPITITFVEKEDYISILVYYCDINITDYNKKELSDLNCSCIISVFELLHSILN